MSPAAGQQLAKCLIRRAALLLLLNVPFCKRTGSAPKIVRNQVARWPRSINFDIKVKLERERVCVCVCVLLLLFYGASTAKVISAVFSIGVTMARFCDAGIRPLARDAFISLVMDERQ